MIPILREIIGNTSCIVNHLSTAVVAVVLFCYFLYIGEDVKPFTPEKTREIVMSLQQPAVFCNMVGDWPALHWDVKHLSAMLDGKTIQFRIGLKAMDLGETCETFSFFQILCLPVITVHSLMYYFSS